MDVNGLISCVGGIDMGECQEKQNQCVLKAGNGEIQVMWMGSKEGVGNTTTCLRLSSAGFVIDVVPCCACTGEMGASMVKRGVCVWGS